MKKRIKLLIAVILMLCFSLAGISLAFLSRSITADNVITFGNVKLKLHETYIDENGKEKEFNTSIVTDVTSEGEQNRIFRVENTGEHPLYVRLKFSVSGKDSEGHPFESGNYLKLDAQLEGWVYKEGWYYYTSILEPDKKTKELITDVIFDIDKLTKEYPGSTYQLDVYAQGVQSENNAADVLKVKGWPEEE